MSIFFFVLALIGSSRAFQVGGRATVASHAREDVTVLPGDNLEALPTVQSSCADVGKVWTDGRLSMKVKVLSGYSKLKRTYNFVDSSWIQVFHNMSGQELHSPIVKPNEGGDSVDYGCQEISTFKLEPVVNLRIALLDERLFTSDYDKNVESQAVIRGFADLKVEKQAESQQQFIIGDCQVLVDFTWEEFQGKNFPTLATDYTASYHQYMSWLHPDHEHASTTFRQLHGLHELYHVLLVNGEESKLENNNGKLSPIVSMLSELDVEYSESRVNPEDPLNQNTRDLRDEIEALGPSLKVPLLVVGWSKGALAVYRTIAKYPHLKKWVSGALLFNTPFYGTNFLTSEFIDRIDKMAGPGHSKYPNYSSIIEDESMLWRTLSVKSRMEDLVFNPDKPPKSITVLNVVSYFDSRQNDPALCELAADRAAMELPVISMKGYRSDMLMAVPDQIIPGSFTITLQDKSHWQFTEYQNHGKNKLIREVLAIFGAFQELLNK